MNFVRPNFDSRCFDITPSQQARITKINAVTGGRATSITEYNRIVTADFIDRDLESEYIATIDARGTLTTLDMRFTNKGMRDLREDGGIPEVEAYASYNDIEGGGMWEHMAA